MMSNPSSDSLLQTVRTRAAAGAWGDVRQLVQGREAEAAREPELAVTFGEALMRLGAPREARDWLSGVLPSLARRGAREALRRAANLRGAAHFELGELDLAEEMFSRAMELGRADGDDLLVARATNNLGAIANLRGKRDAALGMYQLAIPAYQQLGHPLGLAECYHNMAITWKERRDVQQADECERRAIEYAREADNARLVAMARTGRAELCLLLGDAALAAAGAKHAAEAFAALGDHVGEANALRLEGSAAFRMGQADDAAVALERAVALARKHGNALIEAESLRARGDMARAQGRLLDAVRDGRDALAIYQRLGAGDDVQQMTFWVGEVEKSLA